MKKILAKILCGIALTAAVVAPAWAWPTRPLTIVLPSTGGAALDQIARDIQLKLTDKLRVPVIIVYKPGGNAKIGTKFVVQANDDHTVLLIPGQVTINTILEPNSDYTLKELKPISIVAVSPTIVTTAMTGKIKDAKQLLEMPQVAAGAAGGTISEFLIRAVNQSWTYVPYKGGVPMFTDVMAQHIDIGANSTMGSYSYITSKKLEPLMVFSKQRLPQLPDVPTSHEMGVAVTGEVWFGVLGPASMSDSSIKKLSTALVSIASEPAFKNKLFNQGATVLALDPIESQNYLNLDLTNLTSLLERINK
jgi:tripartite-type tricarboxylate transporter receptor subunit TctC